MVISGSTRLAGVIGNPVRHSMSPAIHNAAYEATGLDWAYVALPVTEDRVEAALLGADVCTIPLKVIEQLAKHPLTDAGLAKFVEDSKKIPR